MTTNIHWLNSEALYSEICKKKKTRYSKVEIQETVKFLHAFLWKNRKHIGFDDNSINLVDMLNPVISARLIGFDCSEVPSLGEEYKNGTLYEVAGIIDNRNKKIQVSLQFLPDVRNFTFAHELGHAFLHRENGLHRDKPLDGAKLAFNETEREADIFATEFLMPEKLLRERFNKLFLTEIFVLNENTAFALGFNDYGKFIKRFKETRQLSRILASTEKFNSRHIISLAKQFNVSVEAMAIRLEELGLVG
ncbi:MAG: ImmA/IrrE family metallo-endopeptidase [Methylotenera sp.]|nr:ImmA/IrrE family metallo-endopeptidase [Methylotenera sp.]